MESFLSEYTITILKLVCHRLNINPMGIKEEIIQRLLTIDIVTLQECISDVLLMNQMSQMSV
jgi:hypothetical protein